MYYFFSQYISLPGVAFDAMLLKTGVRIEPITNMSQHLFVESAIRGGLSYACRRFESNDPQEAFQSEFCNAKIREDTAIKYFDANNLYGKVMSMKLPYGGYRWLDDDEIRKLDIASFHENQDEGYFIECDLEYPESLHWLHNDFPVAAETIEITENDFSPYMKKCLKEIYGRSEYKSKKLITTLRDKKNYTCHYLNLKLYLDLGLRLKKIHRVLKFKQKAFVKEYIDICREKRAQAISQCLKNMFKLFSNATYGKFIQNPRKYERAKILTSEESFKEAISSALFKSFKILGDEFCLVFLKTATLEFAQSIATGCAILELSKHHMIHSYYFHFKPNLKSMRLIMTDTDSFLFSCQEKSANAYLKNSNIMDFSNLPKTHPHFSEKNKAVLGKFKDEVQGANISSVVALRSKCYAYKVEKSKSAKRKLKGVKKNFRDCISYRNYKKVIQEIALKGVVQYGIMSKDHRITTVEQKKTCFSSFDDKRYYLCSIHSVPFGSKYCAYDYCFLCYENSRK